MSEEREIAKLKGRISALKDALALAEARNDFLNAEIDRLKEALKKSPVTVSRDAPEGASYGYRWDSSSQRYWAVTVPHEHGPFDSAAEAEAFLREDSLPPLKS